ncbi:MAG TPA: hypothetical protein VHX59_11050 [Mycobacteriales bacterium]|jgi:hypothetical protein|nr:hypothetical protein [Mycobacteriales bacterium]
MSTPDRDDRDLEDLLRRALQEQASRVHPVGDGLAKIRHRAARRRRRLNWIRPVVAAAAAAIAVVGAVEAPSLLNRGHHSSDTASGTASQPGAGSTPSARPDRTSALKTRTSAPAPTKAAPNGPTATPTRAVLAAWPYGDQETAVAHASKDTALRSPQKLAQLFVSSFISTGTASPVELSTEQAVQTGKTLSVTVDRPDLGREICTVQLLQLASAPVSYVVTGAKSDNLTVRTARRVSGALSVPVSGTVAKSEPASNVWSALLAPDGSMSGSTLDTESAGAPPAPRWSIPLNLNEPASTPTIVAAWTVDSSGKVLDFAATGAD